MDFIKGFFSEEVAQEERLNVLKHIEEKTAYGVNFTDAVVVEGEPIDSFVGVLPRWDVKLIRK